MNREGPGRVRARRRRGRADGGARFGELVDALERYGFDSLWLLGARQRPAPDPMVGARRSRPARTKKIKLGTSVQVLPGRNPALLAKAVGDLDVLSGGRALPAFGLGVVDPVEQQAFGVDARGRRAVVRRGAAR